MKLMIGRYIHKQSLIHQLDPRTKLLAGVFFLIVLMQATTALHYALLLTYTLMLVILSKISIYAFLKGLRPLLRIIIFTALLQLFLTRGGETIFYWQFINITDRGIINSLVTFSRFSLLVIFTGVLGLSTKPMDLTHGLEKLLTPLTWLKIPVGKFAFMMASALRFVPSLFDEGYRLKQAQESRGVLFDEGNFIQKIRKYVPFFTPIFINSFRRALEFGDALDVRNYDYNEKRTRFNVLSFAMLDVGFFIVTLLALGYLLA